MRFFFFLFLQDRVTEHFYTFNWKLPVLKMHVQIYTTTEQIHHSSASRYFKFFKMSASVVPVL